MLQTEESMCKGSVAEKCVGHEDCRGESKGGDRSFREQRTPRGPKWRMDRRTGLKHWLEEVSLYVKTLKCFQQVGQHD